MEYPNAHLSSHDQSSSIPRTTHHKSATKDVDDDLWLNLRLDVWRRDDRYWDVGDGDSLDGEVVLFDERFLERHGLFYEVLAEVGYFSRCCELWCEEVGKREVSL
jgi:hypothetical protein